MRQPNGPWHARSHKHAVNGCAWYVLCVSKFGAQRLFLPLDGPFRFFTASLIPPPFVRELPIQSLHDPSPMKDLGQGLAKATMSESPQLVSQDSSSLPPPSSTLPSAAIAENPNLNPPPNTNPNPNFNLNPTIVTPPSQSIPAFTPSSQPLGTPPISQYFIPNLGFQGPMA